MSEAQDKFIGATLSHFRIEAKLGEGGMGRVYKAIDVRLRRPAALKLLSPALIRDEKALKHFQIEAVAASSINHPNICTIYEIDTVRSNTFIAMEYVDGQTLGELLTQKGRLPQSQVLSILEQVCAALSCAHENGIVHQDIKPDNIMISGEQNRVKVMDFGLAKLASDTAKREAGDAATMDSEDSVFVPDLVTTTFSGLMGTAAYMSPEQAKREPVDYRTDIYSLGVMTFELLTGKKPFSGDSQITLLENIVSSRPPALQRKGLHISARWIPIIRRCMQKRPDDRYQSVKELRRDLSGVGKSIKAENNLFHKIKDRLAGKKGRLLLSAAALLMLAFFAAFNSARVFNHSDSTTRAAQSFPASTTSSQAYQYFLDGQKSLWRYDVRAAVSSFQMAVEADNSFAYAYVLLGMLLRWQNRKEDMKMCQAAAQKQLPNLSGWEKQLVLGYLYYFKDEKIESRNAFLKAIELDSTCIDCYFGASLAYERLYDFGSAIMITQKIIDIDSTNIAAFGNMSDMYEWQGNIDAAMRYAKKQLDLILASGDMAGVEGAYESFGRLNHYLGADSIAIDNLIKSLHYDPRNRDASRFLAEAYALSGNIEKAEQTLEEALSMPLKPQERANIYQYYGTLMTFSGQWVSAIEHFGKKRQLFRRENDQKALCVGLIDVCELYFELRKPVLVSREIQWYASQFGVDASEGACFQYVDLNLRLALSEGKMKEAQKWSKILSSLYRESGAVLGQARLAMAQEEYAEIVSALTPIVAKETKPFWGDYLRLRYLLASAQFKSGLYDEAVQSCKKALQARHIFMNPYISLYYIKIIALLSEIYQADGRFDLALVECDRFFTYWKKADPGIPLLVEMQERQQRLRRRIESNL